MKICGIDYSLTSPSICIFDGDVWTIDNCKFYWLNGKKKTQKIFNQFNGCAYPEWNIDLERYDNISEWVLKFTSSVSSVFIEGYSMASKGKVFNIAENAGILKYKLYKLNIPLFLIPPKTAKKFATGNGNANKEMMVEQFFKETSIDLCSILDMKVTNPIDDIVDSYFMCKYGFTNLSRGLPL